LALYQPIKLKISSSYIPWWFASTDPTHSWDLETTLTIPQGEEWVHGRREKRRESGSEVSHKAPHLAAPSRTQQLLAECSSRLNFFLFGDGCWVLVCAVDRANREYQQNEKAATDLGWTEKMIECRKVRAMGRMMGVFGRGQVFIEQAAAVCVGGIQNRLAAKGSHHPASCTWHTHSIDFCFIIS
jgi:hypothetical protein